MIRELTMAIAAMHSNHMSAVARLIAMQETELIAIQKVAERILQQDREPEE